MSHRARAFRRGVCLTAAAIGAACRGETAPAAIGFTYSFSDTAFEAFLIEELERVRAADEPRLTVLGGGISYVSAGGSPLTAEVRRATMLAEDPRVVVTVGPGGSREVLQVTPIYRDAGLPEIVPTATSRLLATVGAHAFLLADNDSVQGDFIGRFAADELKARSAVLIHVPDEYGVGLAAGTAAAFAERGVSLIDRIPIRLALDCIDPADRRAHDAIAAEVALRGTPDVAVLATRTIEAGCLARALRARFPRIALIAGDGTYIDAQFVQRAGAASDGTLLVAFWHPDLDRPGVREFRDRFEQRVRRRARHGDAMFYDGVMLAGAAVRAVGADRGRVAGHLRALGVTAPAYEGITGAIAFGPAGRATLLMTRVRGDRTEIVQ